MPGDIFYTEVDPFLKDELIARGRSGFRRSQKDLDFMLGKVANIQMICYKGTDRKTIIGDSILGGKSVITDKYLPSGPNGYLNDERTVDILDDTFSFTQNLSEDQRIVKDLNVTTLSTAVKNTSRRVPPYIKQANIAIMDNSRGFLNKATIQISIPNPELDLDKIERYWFRPGRFVQVLFEHPDSAVITNKLLDSGSLPPSETILKNYPDLDYDKLKKMNRKDFEGCITSFDFAYQPDGSIDATVHLSGTSNVYTDVSLYIPTPADKTDKDKPEEEKLKTENISFSYTYRKETGKQSATKEELTTQTLDDVSNDFYDVISKEVSAVIPNNSIAGVLRGNSTDSEVTDQWIMWGEDFPKTKKPKANAPVNSYRFITLGFLINFLNKEILGKQTSVPNAFIVCDDKSCFSNYYENIVSTNPQSIFLHTPNSTSNYPKVETKFETTDEKNVTTSQTVQPVTFFEKSFGSNNIPPYQQIEDNVSKAYPSRIFISLDTIKAILVELDSIDVEGEEAEATDISKDNVLIRDFLVKIAARINVATSGAISMKLITHPKIDQALLFYDNKYIGTPIQKEGVKPFSIPMFANHPNGTIVKEFNIKAKLGGRAKQLAFVLNEGGDVSEADIAPYLRFMYQEGGEEEVLKLLQRYRTQHFKYLDQLEQTKAEYIKDVNSEKNQLRLRNALRKYLQYPTPDLKQSSLLNSPIFPYEVDFTIDGINGFRYGDVLEFDVIPARYKKSTVFSIMGLSDTVSNDGVWQTKVTCMMRPKIDMTEYQQYDI